jgi:hypothetical protein
MPLLHVVLSQHEAVVSNSVRTQYEAVASNNVRAQHEAVVSNSVRTQHEAVASNNVRAQHEARCARFHSGDILCLLSKVVEPIKIVYFHFTHVQCKVLYYHYFLN